MWIVVVSYWTGPTLLFARSYFGILATPIYDEQRKKMRGEPTTGAATWKEERRSRRRQKETVPTGFEVLFLLFPILISKSSFNLFMAFEKVIFG